MKYIAICGTVGAGKTTLLRVICGELEPDDGSWEIIRGANLSIGYQKQNCGLSFEGTIWQEMQDFLRSIILRIGGMRLLLQRSS